VNHPDFALSFYQDYPEPLVNLQKEHWDPLLEWVRKTYNVDVIVFDSVLANQQPDATRTKLGEVLQTLDHWELAGNSA
jgi:ATP synthase F1 complex assembly factor 2